MIIYLNDVCCFVGVEGFGIIDLLFGVYIGGFVLMDWVGF